MRTCRECGCTEITPCLTPIEGAAGWQPCGWWSTPDTAGEEPLCTACAPDAAPALTYSEWTTAMRLALDRKVAGSHPHTVLVSAGDHLTLDGAGEIVALDPTYADAQQHALPPGAMRLDFDWSGSISLTPPDPVLTDG